MLVLVLIQDTPKPKRENGTFSIGFPFGSFMTTTTARRRNRRQSTTKQQQQQQEAQIWVASTPWIRDPRELHTILITSLRALWGSWEPYSATLNVQQQRRDNNNSVEQQTSSSCIITCPAAHVPQIQAALTLVTPPPYLQDTLYRLDVVQVKYVRRVADGDSDSDDASSNGSSHG